MGPINTPRNFSVPSDLVFLSPSCHLLSALEVDGLSSKCPLGPNTASRAVLCLVPSCHLLQVFRTCTANWRGIWREFKEQESDGHLRSLRINLFINGQVNNKLKQNLAIDTDPGCSLMSFALSLLWTNVLLNFPTPFLLPLAPGDWHHFSLHHSSPLESPTHC